MPLRVLLTCGRIAVGRIMSLGKLKRFVFFGWIGYVLTMISWRFMSYPPTAHVPLSIPFLVSCPVALLVMLRVSHAAILSATFELSHAVVLSMTLGPPGRFFRET